MTGIKLNPLSPEDREQFIKDNQEAFNYGALEEFGCRDDHFEEEGEIISRRTIEQVYCRRRSLSYYVGRSAGRRCSRQSR